MWKHNLGLNDWTCGTAINQSLLKYEDLTSFFSFHNVANWILLFNWLDNICALKTLLRLGKSGVTFYMLNQDLCGNPCACYTKSKIYLSSLCQTTTSVSQRWNSVTNNGRIVWCCLFASLSSDVWFTLDFPVIITCTNDFKCRTVITTRVDFQRQCKHKVMFARPGVLSKRQYTSCLLHR